MTCRHRELAAGKWKLLSFAEQMANARSEVERTIELLDLTIADARNRHRLRELCRVREVLADTFAFDTIYQSTPESWQRYFRCFLFAARGKS
jgi:hypothetical protein